MFDELLAIFKVWVRGKWVFEGVGPEDVEGLFLFSVEVEGILSSSWSSLRIRFLGGDCEVDIR